jgi:hypothetical protein
MNMKSTPGLLVVWHLAVRERKEMLYFFNVGCKECVFVASKSDWYLLLSSFKKTEL